MLIMYSNLFMPLFCTIRMTRLVQGFDYFTFKWENFSEANLVALLKNVYWVGLVTCRRRIITSPISTLKITG